MAEHEELLHVLRRLAARDGCVKGAVCALQAELERVGRREQRALPRLQPRQAEAGRARARLGVSGRRAGAARDLEGACCGGGVQLEPQPRGELRAQPERLGGEARRAVEQERRLRRDAVAARLAPRLLDQGFLLAKAEALAHAWLGLGLG